MIIFDKLWETMRQKGFSTYRLRESCGIDSKTVNKLCKALDCQPGDILAYEKEDANE